MTLQEKAQELGYEVEVAFEGANGETVYRVKGFGVDTQYPASDSSSWEFLVNEAAHEHRVNMFKMSEGEITLTEDQIFESALAASLSAGLMTEEQATEARAGRA